MIYILIVFLILLLLVLNFQFKLFYLPSKKIRILEYHSISTNGFEDQITIRRDKIIEQFEYLKNHKYTTLWMSDLDNLIANKIKLPTKSVILTFDDGFLDNYTELYPLLQKYNFKAVCFVVLGRIGKNMDWSGEFADKSIMMMNKEQLLEISSHIELGHHTFKHDNYANLSLEEIKQDLQLCQQIIKEEKLNIFPALAYTYGGYYRKKGTNQILFFKLLQECGIKYALRIGNRIATVPLTNKYELQRIDIRGTDSMNDFKLKIKYGRKKLF